MKKIVIRGGVPLIGSVDISGSKNSAVAILPATLLSDTECLLENVPMVTDVLQILDMMRTLGAVCEWRVDNTLFIDPRGVNTCEAVSEKMSRLRGSYYFLGTLLGRFGRARISKPGGCSIGYRPMNFHTNALSQMGVSFVETNSELIGNAENGLFGTDVVLDRVSVGTTINIMMAAAKAHGNTIIHNCAKEPHVVDVANFLNYMGADIRGAGTDVIKIEGVDSLRCGNSAYTIIPDQIEAGTYMIAAAATRGDVVLHNVIPLHMKCLSARLQEMGVGIREDADSIHVSCSNALIGKDITTQPYPGFPTDLQPQMVTLLSLATGNSVVKESIWEARFLYVTELSKMGAEVRVDNTTATVMGGKHFSGAHVICPDLRAGAALVIAGLAAEGTTEIENIKYIDRGYEHLEDKLCSLGARIERVHYDEDEI